VSVFLILLIFSNFANFISTNYAYKDYHYYPRRARFLSDVFTMKDNKFDLTESRASRFDLLAATKNFVQLGAGRKQVVLPAELEYLIHETRICLWEFDYYHQIKRSQKEITITCFSTYLPALLSDFSAKRVKANQLLSEGNFQFLGLYDEGGYDDRRRKAYINVSDEGKLFLVNGAGSRAEVELLASGDLFSPTWKLTAKYDSEKGALLWQNGSVWTRNESLPLIKR